MENTDSTGKELTEQDNDSIGKDLIEKEFQFGLSIKNLMEDEIPIYKALFTDLKDRYNLDNTEDIIMLDRALFNYFLASRGSVDIKELGFMITDSLKTGDLRKLNPVITAVAQADKRFMELMDKLKLSKYKRDSGEMTKSDRRDMRIILTRLEDISKVKEKALGKSSYTIVECTPEKVD